MKRAPTAALDLLHDTAAFLAIAAMIGAAALWCLA